MIKNLLGAAAALSLAAVPTMASAATNPAQSLSISKSARSAAPTKGESKLAGGGAIFALLIVAGIVAIGVVAATKDDNVDTPVSR
jgi:hypothetical protein